jgi:hypothetical protein
MKRGKYNVWTMLEIKILRESYPNGGVKKHNERLASAGLATRTKHSIIAKARELGIKKLCLAQAWTEAESTQLIQLYKPKTVELVAKQLSEFGFPHRTANALRIQAAKLGIARTYKKHKISRTPSGLVSRA